MHCQPHLLDPPTRFSCPYSMNRFLRVVHLLLLITYHSVLVSSLAKPHIDAPQQGVFPDERVQRVSVVMYELVLNSREVITQVYISFILSGNTIAWLVRHLIYEFWRRR